MSALSKIGLFLPSLEEKKVHGFSAIELTKGTFFTTPEGDSFYLSFHDDSGFDFAYRNGVITVTKKEFGELEKLEVKVKTHVPALLFVGSHTYLIMIRKELLKPEFSVENAKKISLPSSIMKLKDAIQHGEVVNKVYRVKSEKGLYGDGIGVAFLNTGIFISSSEVFIVNKQTHKIDEEIDLPLCVKTFVLVVNGIVIIGFLKINKEGEIRIHPVILSEEE